MNDKTHWEVLFENHKFPCVVTEKDTSKILYYNELYRIYFDVKEDMTGKNLYDLVSFDNYIMEGGFPDWEKDEIFQCECFNKPLNIRSTIRITYLKPNNAVFSELVPTEADLEANSEFEIAMSKCMQIISNTEESPLASFMALLCNFYECDFAYVHRINLEENSMNCLAQWSYDPKFRISEEDTVVMKSEFLINWITNESQAGIVSANLEEDESYQNTTLAQVLERFHVKNMTLCAVEDSNQKLLGIVGISNRKDCSKYFDPRLMNAISRFVAQDVNKEVVDAAIFQLNNRDTLTGLYNRTAYNKSLDYLREKSPRTLGVISANANGLRTTNKNLGTSAGDELIQRSATQLSEHFPFDIFRLSGDEFVGLASDIEEEDFLKLVSLLQKQKNSDFSFGHAWEKGNFDISKMMLEADTIMYINKQEYYSSSQRAFDSVSDSTLSDLLSFLENDEFMIYLQPQVRLSDGSLYGAEALIRRFDKTNKKMVFPDQFIPLYEQKSVIRHVDIFVVNQVCKLLQEWGKIGKALPISVNLSRVTLQEYGIVDTIIKICDKYNVPHHLLVIEVTERVGLIENNVASTLIQSFKDSGFHISLDDFGCAYSNIVTLAQIEVDEVKIDKSLVDDLTTSKKNLILVKNVLSMCNELDGASTLAEGIEDENQAKLLHELGCHLGQGYFYSRPIPVADFVENYLKENT